METEDEIEYNTIQQNNYDFNKINSIRESIENMSKFNQVAVLRILTKHKDLVFFSTVYYYPI